jgi:hypothetical protein
MRKTRVGRDFVHVHPFPMFFVDKRIDIMGIISRAEGENAYE